MLQHLTHSNLILAWTSSLLLPRAVSNFGPLFFPSCCRIISPSALTIAGHRPFAAHGKYGKRWKKSGVNFRSLRKEGIWCWSSLQDSNPSGLWTWQTPRFIGPGKQCQSCFYKGVKFVCRAKVDGDKCFSQKGWKGIHGTLEQQKLSFIKSIHISGWPLGGHAGMMGMEKLPSASQATIRGTSTKVRYKVRGRERRAISRLWKRKSSST